MKAFTPFRNPFLITLASGLSFFLIWKAASLGMGNSIILPSPEETLIEALRLMTGADFWPSLSATLARGAAGFAVSLGAGLLVGFPSGRYPAVLRFVKPYLTIIQSTPVLAIILIALIWFRTDIVPVFVSFLMAFPVITASVAEGIRSVEPGLISMARVYRVGRRRMLFGLYLPSVLPFLASGASAALGLCWRVVVAAEVLSQPFLGIGTGLQEAKVRLDTPRVFAWTAAALLISWITDLGFHKILRRLKGRRSS
jgi:NitT/TauT family transport system permease protein